jgi:hypothetical protein
MVRSPSSLWWGSRLRAAPVDRLTRGRSAAWRGVGHRGPGRRAPCGGEAVHALPLLTGSPAGVRRRGEGLDTVAPHRLICASRRRRLCLGFGIPPVPGSALARRILPRRRRAPTEASALDGRAHRRPHHLDGPRLLLRCRLLHLGRLPRPTILDLGAGGSRY